MNTKLIKKLLDDEETRRAIAAPFGIGDDSMLAALKTLSNEPVVGDMITIEISDHVWVRGEYLRTLDDGRLVVDVPELPVLRPIHGKRVDLVIKAKEGEADV